VRQQVENDLGIEESGGGSSVGPPGDERDVEIRHADHLGLQQYVDAFNCQL
jgi:hypothetical protein